MANDQKPKPSLLERVLSIVTEVHAGEGPLTLVLATNLFLFLTAYYFIKPVREGLILELGSGAEYKSYMGAAIACALLLVVPGYARLVDRLPRIKLVVGVTLFFASHLVLFYLAGHSDWLRPKLPLVFFVWVGIFNLMVVAQLWSFANDLFRSEQGKRLFPLVAFGAALGSVFGSKIATWVSNPLKQSAGATVDPAKQTEASFTLLLMGAGVLVACALLFVVAERLSERLRQQAAAAGDSPEPEPEEAKGSKKGAFELVLRNPYLLAIALFTLLFNFANSNGEYMLGKLVQNAAAEAIAHGELAKGQVRDFISFKYADFFFGVNVVTLVLQTFLVSRIVKYGGLAVSLLALPVITLGSGLAVAALPLLAVIRVGKTLENATDYSLNNTARQMLWLPTSRAMKYKAKQAVDTFFVRLGDVCSALLVYVGSQLLAWPIAGFAATNVVLGLLWIGVVLRIMRENKKLDPAPAPGGTAAAAA
jgi:ATP:ADP antiporter, AAA family